MKRRALMPTIVAVSIALAACGADDEPSARQWRSNWQSLRNIIPDAETLEDEGAERCGEILGTVREQQAELSPAPSPATERAFTAWAEDAKALGLDCVEGSEDLDERLGQIERQASAVDDTLGG